MPSKDVRSSTANPTATSLLSSKAVPNSSDVLVSGCRDVQVGNSQILSQIPHLSDTLSGKFLFVRHRFAVRITPEVHEVTWPLPVLIGQWTLPSVISGRCVVDQHARDHSGLSKFSNYPALVSFFEFHSD